MRGTIVLTTLFISSVAIAAPPPFCKVDHHPVARLICADTELSELEGDVFGGFNLWRSNAEGSERQAREIAHGQWIRDRNAHCGLSSISPDTSLDVLLEAKPCMLREYQERKQFYDSVMWN